MGHHSSGLLECQNSPKGNVWIGRGRGYSAVAIPLGHVPGNYEVLEL